MQADGSRTLTLVTLPGSHYVEKARWALQLCGLPFDEEPHAPGFHMLYTERGSVPLLRRTIAGESIPPLRESGEIVRYAHDNATSGIALWPTDAHEREEIDRLSLLCDETLGPATRWGNFGAVY